MSFIFKTKQDRYKEVVQTSPKIIQRTKQEHAASYLGMSVEDLALLQQEIIIG